MILDRYGLVLLIALVPFAGAARAQESGREAIFDSTVHLEARTHTEIPATPRWEESLDLTVRRVDVGDAELYVEEQGAGMAMVLINGGPGGTHHTFHPWFGRAADFARVIYYDQRGTGLSDYEPGPDGYSVEQAVQDLDAVRAALGIERWVLVGYSYGGFLAQYYSTAHPENVAGLVLVGSSPGMWVDTGRSRQQDFISEAESERMEEILGDLRELRREHGWSRQKTVSLLVYNNFLNGDWKRQHLYRPSAEDIAHIALYEWVHDDNFNSAMSRSADAVDLTGAFDGNPIPTLLLEGKWDLTWGEEKPILLSRNHPSARMIVFEDAGHSIYDENPDAFFAELKRFVESLAPVPAAELAAYEEHLADWRQHWKNSPRYRLNAVGWGTGGSRQISAAYRPDWLQDLDSTGDLLRLGFALYDTEAYDEALKAFSKMEAVARADGARSRQAMALIWQGQVLDLLGRRQAAKTRYELVLQMKLDGGARHDQYGLTYEYEPYAAERLRTPFQRLENGSP